MLNSRFDIPSCSRGGLDGVSSSRRLDEKSLSLLLNGASRSLGLENGAARSLGPEDVLRSRVLKGAAPSLGLENGASRSLGLDDTLRSRDLNGSPSPCLGGGLPSRLGGRDPSSLLPDGRAGLESDTLFESVIRDGLERCACAYARI